MKDDSILASSTLRTTLLEQAIELCSSLNTVLEKIGSSRFIKSLASECPTSFGDGGNSLRELSQLEDELQRRLQSINEHRNYILSPISRLPDDVLRHIFTLTLPYKSLESPPWATCLLEVCRRWRAVARDTATIWAFLRLPSCDPGTQYYDIPGHGERVFLHHAYDLERAESFRRAEKARFALSKAALLSVSVSAYNNDHVPSIVDSFLTKCTNRVKSLKVSASGNVECLAFLITCISSTSWSLQHLEMDFTSYRGNAAQMQPFADDLFNIHMPCLVELHLIRVFLPTKLGDPCVALAACKILSLATAHEQDIPSERLLLLLRSCTKVTDLSLTAIGIGFNPEIIPSRVPMLALRSLALSGSASFSIASSIHAPRLTRLDLDIVNSENTSAYAFAKVCDFLKASAPSVQSLEVTGFSATVVEMLLELQPSISSLTYSMTDVGRGEYATLLQVMTGRNGDADACLGRCLETVAFPAWRLLPTDPAYEDLKKFVQHRIRNANRLAPIRRLELGGPRYRAPFSEEALQKEERLAVLVDEFIIRQGLWGTDTRWKFDKVKGRWKRDKCEGFWDVQQ